MRVYYEFTLFSGTTRFPWWQPGEQLALEACEQHTRFADAVSGADHANSAGQFLASLPEYPTKDVLGEKCGLCDTTVGASPACSLPDIIATLAPSARASRPLLACTPQASC